MRRRTVWCLTFALLGGAESCSLFVGLDGLQGSAPDDGADAQGDAAPDAGSADATTTVDAGTDADAGPFCVANPGHTFCADFDEGTLGKWTAQDLGGGTIALTRDASVSPPASLASNMPETTDVPDGAATSGTARLELDAVATTHAHVELDANVCGLASSPGYEEILKLGTETGGGGFGIELQQSALNAQVKVDSLVGNSLVGPLTLSQMLPPNQWIHVSVDVVIGTSGSIRVELNRNSATPALAVSDIDTTNGKTSGYVAFLVGLYTSQTIACITRIDNVLIDAN